MESDFCNNAIAWYHGVFDAAGLAQCPRSCEPVAGAAPK